MSEAQNAAQKARNAAPLIALASEQVRNQALFAMAQGLRDNAELICLENDKDMKAAQEKGTKQSLLDRLLLTPERLESMASALEDLASLPDPTGKILEERVLYNDLKLRRVSVPLGVVAMVYEARPNVTADAAGICIKSGNACVLRGGSLAIHSCVSIAHVLGEALESVGLPKDAISIIESTDRAETNELLKLRGLVDVLIPRGGASLIQTCVENALIPVIETGTGNCHIYVEKTADTAQALTIIKNAKTQRTGVCNACESVLVDADIASEFLPALVVSLAQWGVLIHGDAQVVATCQTQGLVEGKDYMLATEEDWGTEYLSMEISVKVVSGFQEAIDHINQYGTGHSESILSTNPEAIQAFFNQIDAAAVYSNASTRFTDGGEFGLGAEIGISTQKLHARGPFALEALTTYKYLIEGQGQVRG
ncbi:MAG: glutamate-5-semialdehyde dehydrogenase [Anaerotardibacter sp.]